MEELIFAHAQYTSLKSGRGNLDFENKLWMVVAIWRRAAATVGLVHSVRI